MTEYYVYRIKCTTEGIDKYWTLAESESAPTTCPTNTAHTVDANSVTITNTISDSIVKIKEEDKATGGHFGCATLCINAIKNTTSSSSISWPHPISAMSINFITGTGHNGDKVSMSISKNTIIGAITAGVTGATAAGWTGINYTAGEYVTYTHPIFGDRPYTCILDTVSQEAPSNATYWQHGREINVGATVTANTDIGYYLNLFDGPNTDDLGRVLKVDKNNNKVYVEFEPSITYSATSPTYVRQTVYVFKDYDLGESWGRQIGESKIGGSYIPADVLVTADYENVSTDTDKKLIGHVEYLY